MISWDFWYLVLELHVRFQENFSIVSIFVCNRAHVRSRRSPWEFCRKSDFRKYQLCGYICHKSSLNVSKIHDFREILIFGISASCEISRKFFTSLRFVCNRAHVISRRAPWESGRKSKSEYINYMSIFIQNTH